MTLVWIASLTLAVIALCAGLLLGLARRRMPRNDTDVIDAVNALLPQTQCAQCGFPGCRPYARAIVADEAPINLCPPGGEATVARIAEQLGRDPLPPAQAAPTGRVVAQVDESLCIGCLHCRNACPVDAIVGARNLMHSVIEDECTGCELCIEPCPVDCISLRQVA